MSWIDDFVLATENIPSPPIFRLWAAISTLAGALERKVWAKTLGSPMYPNLYIILVAPPGVGKTEVTWRVRDMWSALTDHNLAHSSITKAALIDNLHAGVRTITRPDQVPAVITFHSLLVASNELGVLIPAYDMEFMNTLTDLYDGKPYSELRRSRPEPVHLPKPNLNMLAACTPAYLTSTLPEGAWDQGFTSRTILVYSGERVLRDLFIDAVQNEALVSTLKDELISIGALTGEMMFDEEGADLINRWHMQGGAPHPDHPKLVHYLTRRTAHIIKLSMIASIAESPNLIITKAHVQTALDWLTEAELYMPDIFKAMANSGHSQLLAEVWHFVQKAHTKSGGNGCHETRVINFVSQKTPAHNVERTIEVMVKGNLLRKEFSAKGGYVYKPIAPDV